MSSTNREEFQDCVPSQEQSITASTTSANNLLSEVSQLSFIPTYPINTPSTLVARDMSHFTLRSGQPESFFLTSPTGSQIDDLYSPTEPMYGPDLSVAEQLGITPTEESSGKRPPEYDVDKTERVSRRRAQNRAAQQKCRNRRLAEWNSLLSQRETLKAQLQGQQTVISSLVSQRDKACFERDEARSRCAWLEKLLREREVQSATWQDSCIFPNGES